MNCLEVSYCPAGIDSEKPTPLDLVSSSEDCIAPRLSLKFLRFGKLEIRGKSYDSITFIH